MSCFHQDVTGEPVQVAVVADNAELLPIVPYIARDSAGNPAIVGKQCGACGEVFLGFPFICARCGTRIASSTIALSKTGRLYVWTTVHRSLPGVATPFVSAIVDLDGGGAVRGTLIAPESDIQFDMQVRLVFERASKTDAKGRSYLTYHFVKA
jgi:uncharacterized protein